MGAGASTADCERFEEVMRVRNCYDVAPIAVDCYTRAEKNDLSSSDEKSLASKVKGLSLVIPSSKSLSASSALDTPPALLPYLRSLFMAHITKPGEVSLSVHTFWDIVESLFAHILSDFDNSRLELYLDAKTDNPVTWSEANEYFTVQFNILKQRKQDYWVGLKDISGNDRYFWYNIKDDKSFWMNETERSHFLCCMAMPAAQRPKRFLAPAYARACTPHSGRTLAVVASPTARSSPYHAKSTRGAAAVMSH